MSANSDGELNQHSRNNMLHEAILTEDAMEITNILKIRTADSPLHSPIGFLGNGHLQHAAILPIHLAAIHRKERSLEALLLSGADPERRDHRGCTALHLVITHWPRVTRTGSEPRSKFETTMAAAERRAEACLSLLCRFGADVNARVERDGGPTAVHLAVRHGALPAVGILARHGARVDARDGLGMRPLHAAAAALDTDTAASLVALGADVDSAVPRSGSTPLHMAVLAELSRPAGAPPGGRSCVGLLLERGAAPDARDGAGRTPLHLACRDGREETADALIGHGADVNAPTPRGENCLFLLLDRAGRPERASLLRKVLGLTYPLRVTDLQGALPGALLLPERRAQRDLLLRLCREPLSLRDTCRIHIRRRHGERSRLRLREVLPERLHSFLYSSGTFPLGVSFPDTSSGVDNQTARHSPRTPAHANSVEAQATAENV